MANTQFRIWGYILFRASAHSTGRETMSPSPGVLPNRA